MTKQPRPTPRIIERLELDVRECVDFLSRLVATWHAEREPDGSMMTWNKQDLVNTTCDLVAEAGDIIAEHGYCRTCGEMDYCCQCRAIDAPEEEEENDPENPAPGAGLRYDRDSGIFGDY